MPHIPLEELTKRQLLLHLANLVHTQNYRIERMEDYMSDLSTSVDALKGAVDTMAVRFASQVEPLRTALASAQEQLADLVVEDDAVKEQLSAALADASAAVDSIDSDVAELNAIGAEPDVPVEPVPVDEMPAPPSDGEAPAPTDAQPVDGSPDPTPTDAPAPEVNF